MLLNIIVKCMLITCVLTVAVQSKKVIVKRAASDDNGGVNFDVKLTNVDSSSAEFELLDDNSTTINYVISYTLTSNGTSSLSSATASDAQLAVSIESKDSFKMQTNSMSMLAQQEKLMSDDDAASALKESKATADSGELYTSEDKARIRGKSYEQTHRFLVPDLEPNREYHLSLNIRAREAHLSSLLTGVAKSDKPTVEKQFPIMFKTTFDYDLAASLACNNSIPNMPDGGGQRLTKLDNLLYVKSSCYVKDTSCTKCKPTCYEVKQTRNQQAKQRATATDVRVIKPILCEACPCDTSRSTGECYVVQSDQNGGSSDSGNGVISDAPSGVTLTIKCKQCIEPYVGVTCNECDNEGIDYYKNEDGECVKCFCNNNAAQDVYPGSSKRRKCQAITGMCVDCMFNTTGKYCDKCLMGYVGDALKRTCVEPVRNSSALNNDENRSSLAPNEKYSYKKLALFSLYIFCVLTLVLLTFLCIKSRYYDNGHMLKNGSGAQDMSAASSSPPSSLMSPSGFLRERLNDTLRSLDQTTKSLRSRAAIYFGSMCPTTMRFVRVASNQTNAGYSNANAVGANDDDRLNLAEYQMFDDSLLNNGNANGGGGDDVTAAAFTYRASFNDDLDDSHNDTRNPYRSLTIKT